MYQDHKVFSKQDFVGHTEMVEKWKSLSFE